MACSYKLRYEKYEEALQGRFPLSDTPSILVMNIYDSEPDSVGFRPVLSCPGPSLPPVATTRVRLSPDQSILHLDAAAASTTAHYLPSTGDDSLY